jgi:hypothetical protein
MSAVRQTGRNMLMPSISVHDPERSSRANTQPMVRDREFAERRNGGDSPRTTVGITRRSYAPLNGKGFCGLASTGNEALDYRAQCSMF